MPDESANSSEAAAEEDREFKYFIKRNESWTWDNKYVTNTTPLLRPLWIATVDNESTALYEPATPAQSPAQIRNWIKIQKIADRSVDLGVEQKEITNPEETHEEDGTVVDEVEEVWETEEILVENWVEDGWTDEQLPQDGQPKVVQWSRQEVSQKDCLEPPLTEDERRVMNDYDDSKLPPTTRTTSSTTPPQPTTSSAAPESTVVTHLFKTNTNWPLNELERGMETRFDTYLPFSSPGPKTFQAEGEEVMSSNDVLALTLTPGTQKKML